MSINIRHLYSNRNSRWEVKVIGEIDINTADEVKEKINSLVDEREDSVLLDMEDVSYIDSTGLGIFIALVKRLKSSGKNLILLNPNRSIVKLFEITGLDQIFTLRKD
ncbi:MAG: anti-anti-sigma factor [Clostridiales bacterium]|nr:MAG: anti-anti-sigma factor [Clostridiales bacterium]